MGLGMHLLQIYLSSGLSAQCALADDPNKP